MQYSSSARPRTGLTFPFGRRRRIPCTFFGSKHNLSTGQAGGQIYIFGMETEVLIVRSSRGGPSRGSNHVFPYQRRKAQFGQAKLCSSTNGSHGTAYHPPACQPNGLCNGRLNTCASFVPRLSNVLIWIQLSSKIT